MLNKNLTDKTIFYLTASEAKALSAFDEFQLFCGREKLDLDDPLSAEKIETIPLFEGSIYSELYTEKYWMQQRMASLARLRYGYQGKLNVISIQSLSRKVIPPDTLDDASQLLARDIETDRNRMTTQLIESGYQNVDIVDDYATFSVRGQVVDVFVPAYSFPARIIFFDDIIESIFLFDPDTQKRLKEIDELLIHPVMETIKGDTSQFRQKLLQKADEVCFPSSKTKYILQRIENGESFFGMEAFTPLYHQRLVPVFEYFPDDSLLIIESPEEIDFELANQLEEENQNYQKKIQDAQLAFPPKDFYLDSSSLQKAKENIQTVELFETMDEPENSAEFTNLVFNRFSFNKNLENNTRLFTPLLDKLQNHLHDNYRILLCSPEKQKNSPLARIFQERQLQIADFNNKTPFTFELLEPEKIYFRQGHLRKGFVSETQGIVTCSEEEIFGRKIRRPKRKDSRFVSDITNLDTIKTGDRIVHKVHGIGIYRGLYKMEPAGIPGDYIKLEYRGNDLLYLPAHRISSISRYKGGKNIRLDKLGGSTWEKTRKKVEKKVKNLAEKLLQMASERAAVKGYAYSVDDPLFYEFEATFPYDETDDQIKAINEVVEDMTSSTPMEKLICGDVGYGKTEIAMRAAFIAILAGKQVALLAPTTLLVEQHYRTFRERMDSFAISTAALSRFQSTRKQKLTLDKLAEGEIDIVIGTHRLLSKDINYKDLGLLIIDEEQKFGVAQKDKFKFTSPNLDVLYLSATPIPRTLHMSVMGLKDISLITTPPSERLAVKTYISPVKERILKQAIEKEIQRGGQVFAVVSKIEGSKDTNSIEDWFEKLSQLVPEAKIAMAHGKMRNDQLERIMFKFLNGSFNLLVSTNIIGSGLDIASANTIMVLDAQNFGLAQLYQLRGRVGRGRNQGYAYFFITDNGNLTLNAQKRLAALRRHTRLGSGFNLASEDLSIRGAGELLGKKQSGSIAAVGFDTYVEIIEEAVNELKGEKPIPLNDPKLNVDLPCYIPDDFILEPTERLVYYRRLGTAVDIEEVDEQIELIADKFGTLPTEVELLGELMKIKTQLRKINALKISTTPAKALIRLDKNNFINGEKFVELIKKNSSFILQGPEQITVKLNKDLKNLEKLRELRTNLHLLTSCAT